MDIGSAVGRQNGVSEEHLAELSNFQHSALFTDAEKAALRYTEEMCKTPVDVPDEVFNELARHFDPKQIVELTSGIVLENARARFNRALEIGSDNLCALPADHPVRKLAVTG